MKTVLLFMFLVYVVWMGSWTRDNQQVHLITSPKIRPVIDIGTEQPVKARVDTRSSVHAHQTDRLVAAGKENLYKLLREKLQMGYLFSLQILNVPLKKTVHFAKNSHPLCANYVKNYTFHSQSNCCGKIGDIFLFSFMCFIASLRRLNNAPRHWGIWVVTILFWRWPESRYKNCLT